jgi:hypothetical protein
MTNQTETGFAICSRRRGFVSARPSGRMWMLAPSLPVLLVAVGAGLWGGGHVLAQASPAGQSSSASTSQPAKKLSASAIQIEPVENGDVALPPEFRVAVYEHLLTEVSKSGKFQHVYRSGDRAAGDLPDLVILRMKTKGFKQGSERTRAVTTVAGATSLDLGVQITGRDGKVLVDRDLTGKVRFIGGNLRATYDFSKKVAKILEQSF